MKVLKKQRKSINKNILIIFLLVILTVFILIIFLPYFNIKISNINNTQTIQNQELKTGTGGSDQPLVPEATSQKQKISMDITSAQEIDSIFKIRTSIYLNTDSGTCELIMSKDSVMVINRKVDVQSMSSTSTCRGFDIATSDISSGKWNINIKFDNDNYFSESSKEVNLE